MIINLKRFLFTIVIFPFIFVPNVSDASTSFDPIPVRVGGSPMYGVVFGEVARHYRHAPGGSIYARGLYQINVSDRLMIYPGLGWGILYLKHKSESGRELFLFPFSLNIFFNSPVLNFNTDVGVFALTPYIGIGLYLNHYRSRRTKSTAGDFGYQAGIKLEYRHDKMKGAYVEAGIDHLFTTNFKRYLPVLVFSVGAGYSIDFRGSSSGDMHQ